MIKLQRNLFEGEGPLTQAFGLHPEWYAKFGLKGHNGADWGIPNYTNLYCCINGTVTERLYDGPGYGKYVKIENDQCGVLYAHMSKWSVEVGDKIVAGQCLGTSNNTGNSTGPHLHFGVFPKPRDRTNGYAGYIDPLGPDIEWVESINVDEEDDCQKKLKEWRDRANKREVIIDEMQIKQDELKLTIKDLEKKLLTQDPLSSFKTSELIEVVFNRIWKGRKVC